ncbi:hypothetical protein EYF80_055023 [Liparis tanakae]|uniref:Uncharacterized protein n=1 Tax=Liparis tanakae TaxID=230148 RepID=A0A4Z2F1Q3_9TELE|nr:hypothetical protein EYF80_055023 [Liparis tanakae]
MPDRCCLTLWMVFGTSMSQSRPKHERERPEVSERNGVEVSLSPQSQVSLCNSIISYFYPTRPYLTRARTPWPVSEAVPAVDDDGPGVWNGTLGAVDLLQEPEDAAGLVGHAVVRPAQTGHFQLPQDVVLRRPLVHVPHLHLPELLRAVEATYLKFFPESLFGFFRVVRYFVELSYPVLNVGQGLEPLAAAHVVFTVLLEHRRLSVSNSRSEAFGRARGERRLTWERIMTWVTLVLRSTLSCFSSLVRTERTKSPGLLWLSRTRKLPALPLSVSSFSASRPDRCPWYHLAGQGENTL